MTTRKKRPAPTGPGDSVLRDILESAEYREALKARMLAGKASASELGLARDLGMAVPVLDRDTEFREALRAMDREARAVFGDILRMTNTAREITKLRVIRTGTFVGLGWGTATTDPVPVDQTSEPTDTDLLP